MSIITINNSLAIPFVGPQLDKGTLPAIFYFSLSAEESLMREPFNHPVQCLMHSPIRIFSMTIPGHEKERNPKRLLTYWAEEYKKGHDILAQFFERGAKIIKDLIQSPHIDKTRVAFAGLSRGAFVAAHIASKLPQVQTILGFAPLTVLSKKGEFKGLKKKVKAFDLEKLTPNLFNRKLRFYIGNRDKRVGTENCFSFISKLTDVAYENKILSAPIEMIITPSIGYQGHGTAFETFKEGALWLKKELLL